MRRLSMLPPPATLLPNAPWMCRSPARNSRPQSHRRRFLTGTKTTPEKKKHTILSFLGSRPGRSGDRGLLELRRVPVALGRHLL